MTRVRKNLFAFALLAAALAAAPGAPAGVDWGLDPKEPSVAVPPVAPVTVAPGRTVKVPMKFRLTKGYHVNSNLPKSDLLIPTVLSLKANSPQLEIRILYPKGENIAFPFAPDEPLNVYSGEFTVTVEVKASPSITPGGYTVSGDLKYQACNDRACFPPKKIPVDLKVAVSGKR